MTLEHHTAQFHHVEPSSRRQRLVYLDVADPEITELPLPLRQRLQHFGESQHADHPAVVHYHQRADIVLRHHFDRIEDGPSGAVVNSALPLIRKISLTSIEASFPGSAAAPSGRGYSRAAGGLQRFPIRTRPRRPVAPATTSVPAVAGAAGFCLLYARIGVQDCIPVRKRPTGTSVYPLGGAG